MKIEKKEKQFEPIVITIETREELEHFVAAFANFGKDPFIDAGGDELKYDASIADNLYNALYRLLNA